MALVINHLTGQGTGGQAISNTTKATVHTVPSGEAHKVIIRATNSAACTVNTKINGETTGHTVAIEADAFMNVFIGVVDGISGTPGSRTVECTTSTGTSLISGEYTDVSDVIGSA